MNAEQDDAALGRKTRELMQALVDVSAMLAVDAPTPALRRQQAILKDLFTEIANECGVDWEADIMEVAMAKMPRLAEILMQPESPGPELPP